MRAAAEVMKSDVVRKVGFTGSTAVGKILAKQAADTVKKVRSNVSDVIPTCAAPVLLSAQLGWQDSGQACR